MMSKLATLGLTLTAIVPVGIAYSIVAFLHSDIRLGTALFGTCAGLIATCWVLWRYAVNNLERVPFRITAAEIADHENIAFLLLYLLPLITDYASGPPSWRVWVPVAAVVTLGIITSNSYHFNPLLGVMGWHFYKVSTPEGITYVMISKRQLHAVRDQMTVGQLTEYILVDLIGE